MQGLPECNASITTIANVSQTVRSLEVVYI